MVGVTQTTVQRAGPSIVDVLKATVGDGPQQLWVLFRRETRLTYHARLLVRDPETEENQWFGDRFEVDPGRFMCISCLREREENAVRLDQCSDEELALFFGGVAVPFSIGIPSL